LFAGKAYYDTNSIEIRHYQIQSYSTATLQHRSTFSSNGSALIEALDGIKVAHLSDLHIRSIGLKEERLLEILRKEKPDLVFITGDSIDFKGPYEPAMTFFHQIEAPLGVYAVMGNTEYSNENLCHEKKSGALKGKQNPMFLRNAHLPLRISGKLINIVGVDDPVDKKSNLIAALREGKQKIPSILLAHSPEIFEEASDEGVDLVLCGHTHGGQIFITRYLRKIFPLIDPALEFLDGFFQKGKTLMYVSRGIGNSFLPLRFGVKPEITFFEFSANTKNLINSTNSSNSINPTNSINPMLISNNLSKTIFTGLSLLGFIETFDVLNIFDSLHLTAAQQHRSTTAQKTLFDFESDSDLKRLNWECHKWFELSEENTTSGKYSLKVSLPPGQYPGISFYEIPTDWSGGKYLKMDVFNPSKEDLTFHIRIDDTKSGWEYADRFDMNLELGSKMNHITIPTDSIKTNVHIRPLNLKNIKRMMVFIPDSPKQREIYIDHIRLE
jgi:predicted MPP superfamily phosphohydrolase